MITPVLNREKILLGYGKGCYAKYLEQLKKSKNNRSLLEIGVETNDKAE